MKRMTKSHGYVFLTSLGLSFILIFSTQLKNMGVSSLEQLFFRVVLGALILAPILAVKGQLKLPKKEDMLYFILLGLIFGSSIMAALSAVAFGAVIAVVGALGYTQPLYTALISHLSKDERINLKKLIIIILGILGIFLITRLSISDILALKINAGILFALLTGPLYALYLFLKRGAHKRGYKPLQISFNSFLLCIPWAIIFGLTLKNFSTNQLFIGVVMPNSSQFLMLLAFAIFSTTLPYTFINAVNPSEIKPTTEGMMLLLDPVMHNIWAIIFFAQFVTQYIGLFLVLGSAALSIYSKT